MKKDISKRKTPFFSILQGFSNKQEIIFHDMHFNPYGIDERFSFS